MTATTSTLQRCLAALATVLAGALLLASCGGGADRTKAQVRLVNASGGYASLDMRVADTVRQGGVTYGGTDGYVEIDPGKADTTITSAGSATALLSFTPALDKNKHYSLLAYGALGALKQLLLDENTSLPDTNRTLLRVVNAAPDAGNVDVYLTGTDDALASSVPVQSAAAFGTLNSFLTVISGNWRLRVTATGSKTDVRLDLSSLALTSKQVATLVLTPGRGGALINALLVSQEASIARLDNTQARVRVAAGVADSAAVVASVGGSTLLGNNAVVIGNYINVAAGSQPVAVSVNGTALAATTRALTAGADYTLLVHGPSAAPLASWIEDDNRLPADTSQARLRLVNGVSGPTVTLAMTLDLSPVAAGVVAGAASDYALVPPSSTARLAVSASGAGTLYGSTVDQTLLAGSTYTVFVLGGQTVSSGQASAVGTLRKDR